MTPKWNQWLLNEGKVVFFLMPWRLTNYFVSFIACRSCMTIAVSIFLGREMQLLFSQLTRHHCQTLRLSIAGRTSQVYEESLSTIEAVEDQLVRKVRIVKIWLEANVWNQKRLGRRHFIFWARCKGPWERFSDWCKYWNKGNQKDADNIPKEHGRNEWPERHKWKNP